MLTDVTVKFLVNEHAKNNNKLLFMSKLDATEQNNNFV
jgi:hypothetical protein